MNRKYIGFGALLLAAAIAPVSYGGNIVAYTNDFDGNETFAPGDLEIDPTFDLVAEWADYRITAGLRNQDMIATKLFEFMERDGYCFHEDWTIRLIGIFGRLSAHLSEQAKDMIADVVPKVPPNMKRKTIAVVAMLHKTAEPILEQLTVIEHQEIARTGHPPHPRDVLGTLDKLKAGADGHIGYLRSPAAKGWA